MEIRLDEVDLNILEILNGLGINESQKRNSITTTSLAKKIFPNIRRNVLVTKDAVIRQKLKKLNHYNLILIEKKENIHYYDLIANNCYIGKLKGKKAIYLFMNEKWNAFTL